MRRILFSLGAIALGGAATLAACSSDDSTGAGTDAGGDTATADNYVPPQDSGKKDSGGGTDSGGPCQTCSDFLLNGPGSNPLCTDNGPPSSEDLANAWLFGCVCNQDGGPSCYSQCTDTCVSFLAPSDTCATCFNSTCADSLAACAADGADGGTGPSDAGDGGD